METVRWAKGYYVCIQRCVYQVRLECSALRTCRRDLARPPRPPLSSSGWMPRPPCCSQARANGDACGQSKRPITTRVIPILPQTAPNDLSPLGLSPEDTHLLDGSVAMVVSTHWALRPMSVKMIGAPRPQVPVSEHRVHKGIGKTQSHTCRHFTS